jgi:HK97 family phage prohead protease
MVKILIMPIPKPTGSETEDEFMGRCMKDPQMQSEYDKGQRTAVCLSSYRGKETEKQMTEVLDQNNQENETKYFDINCEWKVYGNDDDEEDGKFSGYASIFGNKDLGNDIVEKGAFASSLRKKSPKQIKMLFMHKTDEPIGVYEKMEEDEKGLRVEGKLALGTQRGKEVYELMKMGAIDGLSIGYRVDAKGYNYDDDGKKRRLKNVDLMEISAVTFPMNPKARIRKVKGAECTIREWEEILRDVGGLSRNESKMGAKALVKALSQRDVDDGMPELLNSINNLTTTLKGDK